MEEEQGRVEVINSHPNCRMWSNATRGSDFRGWGGSRIGRAWGSTGQVAMPSGD